MEEVNPGINKSLLTSLYWMLRQTCIYEKKKRLLYKCESCNSQAPFPYKREKMSLREGKNLDL